MRQRFSQNPVAQFIRNDVPQVIADILGHEKRYLIEGSAGKGNWANVPWAAIFDRFITTTAQDGFYVVYLVKEDYSGVYLSLNQGITAVRKIYGSSSKQTKEALSIRSSDYFSRLGKANSTYIPGKIDLAVNTKGGLGAFYEYGSICAKLYTVGDLPDDRQLEGDLKEMIEFYKLLATKELHHTAPGAVEVDEVGLFEEDLLNLREHKRIERNQKLIQEVKKTQGYICRACNFDFSKAYGDAGKNYIEAHHLTPLSTLRKQKVLLDPRKDFVVLCSNCHKIIHRTSYVSDLDAFRNTNVKVRYIYEAENSTEIS